MAKDNAPQPEGRQPISPAKRKRLQTAFQYGAKSSSEGNYDYATEMFLQCVKGDPGNAIYVQNFLGNLQKKYSNNKKGSRMAGIKGAGAKGKIKKATLQKQWDAVLTEGLAMLQLNPWDTSTLLSMGTACENLEYDEAQLVYLKMAMDANLKDPDVNRQCALALAHQGRFDEAIVCWTRVLQAKPGDEEANRAIGDLTVEKTIHRGGYEGADSSKQVRAEDEAPVNPGLVRTPEQQLQKAIDKDPENVSNYLELANLHISARRNEEALKVLADAQAVAGGDLSIREQIEDLEITQLKEQVAIAEQQHRKSPDDAKSKELYDRYRAELNAREIQVLAARVERYPTNVGLKYDLGLRLKRARNYKEAITMFQKASGDPQRRGIVLLELGQCFQQIKQYKLALDNYEKAVEAIPDKDEDSKKQALYLAGRLAEGLKDLAKAEKHYTALAGLDFGYRDVAERLDKIQSGGDG
ncbi:MAG: tetratricopeptide repeat protein [Planctomycetales bacterium]|nr:tetratricopeptide repeat protein [Planctomycetales bacterium]